ncbi:MAG: hypothetical protein V4525_01265 [Pseudomonadota bacterium]
MQQKAHCILLILSSALTACSTNFSQMSPIDFSHGKRRALITKFYTPDMPREVLPPCLRPLPKKTLEEQQFAEVHYHGVRDARKAVVAIPAGENLHIGDELEIAPESCAAGQLSNVTRVLSFQNQE